MQVSVHSVILAIDKKSQMSFSEDIWVFILLLPHLVLFFFLTWIQFLSYKAILSLWFWSVLEGFLFGWSLRTLNILFLIKKMKWCLVACIWKVADRMHTMRKSFLKDILNYGLYLYVILLWPDRWVTINKISFYSLLRHMQGRPFSSSVTEQ